MDTTYLREFLVMSELCNYTTAADALFISQPTLYKHIKSLETEVGVPLFEKHGKKIELSRYGKMFIPHVQKILEECQQYLTEVETELQNRSNALIIATNYNIKDLTKGFFKDHRQYKLHAILHESVENAFENPDCELALFCFQDTPDEQYEYVEYCNEEVVVVVNSSHMLADRIAIALDELRNEDFITPSSTVCEYISPSFLYSGIFDHFQPKVAMNIEYGTEAAQLVSQGFGISLLFRRPIEALHTDNLKLISLNPPVLCPVCLCWRKGSDLSIGAKKFIEYIQKQS